MKKVLFVFALALLIVSLSCEEKKTKFCYECFELDDLEMVIDNECNLASRGEEYISGSTGRKCIFTGEEEY